MSVGPVVKWDRLCEKGLPALFTVWPQTCLDARVKLTPTMLTAGFQKDGVRNLLKTTQVLQAPPEQHPAL